MEIKNNMLHLGGIPAKELLRQFGSPLYVYEEEVIRAKYREVVNAIGYPQLRMYYACKANTSLAIMKVLLEEGAGIDAVSPGEIHLALKVGFQPDRILYTGNNVTDDEMRYAIEKKVLINMDSLSQMERYGRIHPNSKVTVRINPDIGAGHHDHVITGGPDSKFGIYYTKADDIKRTAKKHGLTITGLHMHVGSCYLNYGPFLDAMKNLLQVARQFPDLESIDFGGGLGVVYKPNDKPIDLRGFGRDVRAVFDAFTKSYGRELMMAFENGRYYVCEAGVLLTRVNTLKEVEGKTFVGTDSGFNHLIRHAMYGSYHPILNADKVEGDPKRNVTICGNICESGDCFARDREMPPIAEGDVMAILNAGAYGFSMASEYNSRVLPAEVMVQHGKSRIIRKRGTYDDLCRNQTV